MTELHFANPNWGHAIWLVLVLVGLLLWLDHRGGAALNRFLSTAMQARLARRASRMRRWFAIICMGLALVCFVIALMRPQWGLEYRRTPRVGAQIMVCLDVSKSMLAEDAAPNRLERAKAEVSDLLTYLQGDQVGLTAFAGKAAVLCPLTPDFGFFRMILNDAGPHSVGLGGTILSTPLRKAIEGFRSAGELSRVILLITDGEDHAQHEDDLKAAAKAAAERGIKVIAVGFGDEQGSPIQITDQRTGVRTTLRDADGKEVMTRLDGDTLRELALITEGAYLPAGTGLLDLESIYNTHIYPLMRGDLEDRGRAVRRDIFQWVLMMGILLFLLSVAVGNAPVPDRSTSMELKGRAAIAASIMLLISLGMVAPNRVFAQSVAGDRQEKGIAKTPATEDPNGGSSERELSVEIPEDPREAYNEALPLIGTRFEQAEELLATARSGAGTDGELRFRATYNRGCLDVARADQLLEETPQQALKHLQSAADWFRDAVRLRPKNSDARHNLEVVLRRALQLADALAPKDEQDLAQELDRLIASQRELLNGQRIMVERASSNEDPHLAENLKSEFRQLAVSQRELLSDADSVAGRARNQREAIMSKKHEERTPEERIRAVQLEAVQHYIFQAAQRMGQSRSQLRRKQSLRAYRRGTSALEQLKRARDQLRDPVELLTSILTDATRLAGETRHFVLAEEGPVVGKQSAPERPAWLDLEYLEQSQTPTTERTAELSARLEAGLSDVPQPSNGPQPSGATDVEDETSDPETLQFLERVREAAPFVKRAQEDFELSGEALQDSKPQNAYEKQVAALQALAEARERFLELRGLIELAYADEKQIQAIVSASEEQAAEETHGLYPLAAQAQIKNIDRGRRLGALIADQLGKIPEEMGPPTAQQSRSDQPQDAQQQQLQMAQHLLDLAVSEMYRASDYLQSKVDVQAVEPMPSRPESETDDVPPSGPEKVEPDRIELEDGKAAVDQAVEHLQGLRRLFYSIVEHLRETAERQAELNDETEATRTLNQDQPASERLGPFVSRQRDLANISGEIANALHAQAQQEPPPAADPNSNTPLQQQAHDAQAMTRQFEQAAELVDQASEKMQTVIENMDVEEPGFEEIRKDQDEAFNKLIEALALLQPPQQQQQPDQQQEQQQQQGEDEQEQEQEDQQNEQQNVDPRRLLQAVRDREAQRRREKAKQQQPAGYSAVDKDW